MDNSCISTVFSIYSGQYSYKVYKTWLHQRITQSHTPREILLVEWPKNLVYPTLKWLSLWMQFLIPFGSYWARTSPTSGSLDRLHKSSSRRCGRDCGYAKAQPRGSRVSARLSIGVANGYAEARQCKQWIDPEQSFIFSDEKTNQKNLFVQRTEQVSATSQLLRLAI